MFKKVKKSKKKICLGRDSNSRRQNATKKNFSKKIPSFSACGQHCVVVLVKNLRIKIKKVNLTNFLWSNRFDFLATAS